MDPAASVLTLPTLLSWQSVGYFLLAALLWLSFRAYVALWAKPQKLRRFLQAQGVPGPEVVPVFGNMFDMRKLQKRRKEDPLFAAHSSASPYFAHLVDTHGPVVLVHLMSSVRVLLADPALVRAVYVTHSSNFHKPETFRTLFSLLGDGLVTSNGELWERQRRLINPAFKHGAIKRMLPVMLQCTQEAVSRWRATVTSSEAGEVAHFEALLGALTLDVIGRAAFGANIGGLDRENRRDADLLIQAFVDYFDTFSQSSLLELLPFYRLLPTEKNVRRNSAKAIVHTAMMRIIAARRQQVAAAAEAGAAGDNDVTESSKTDVDLLGLMMAATEDGNDKAASMSDQQLMDECVTFLVAGHETTSNLLSWTMVLLSQHPEWQEKAREEVRQVLSSYVRGDNIEDLEFDKLNELKVVGMILNETLRLYPPAYAISRSCVKTTKVSDSLTLPAGSGVIIPIGVLHRRKELWGEDADEFKPLRFESGTTGFGGAFIPFSLGPRVCIGQNFAMAEAKMILALLLLNFSWELTSTYRHHPEINLTLRCRYGVPLQMKVLNG